MPPELVDISFFTIYRAVFWEAFLWGAGTAIGELPPYFVTRAASAAGGIDEELEELVDNQVGGSKELVLTEKENESCMVRSKKRLAVFLRNYAFITVLCMASVSQKLEMRLCHDIFMLLFRSQILCSTLQASCAATSRSHSLPFS